MAGIKICRAARREPSEAGGGRPVEPFRPPARESAGRTEQNVRRLVFRAGCGKGGNGFQPVAAKT